MSTIEKYAELQVSLKAKRNRLKIEDEKQRLLSRSVNKNKTGSERTYPDCETIASLSLNSTGCVTSPANHWDEEIPFSLFQSQLFHQSESTFTKHIPEYGACMPFCDFYTFPSDLDFCGKVCQLSVSCCSLPTPSIFAVLSTSRNVLLFSMDGNDETVLLWKRCYSNPVWPVAVQVLTIPTTDIGVVMTGLFILAFNIDMKLFTSYLYIARVGNDRSWDLLDVHTSNVLLDKSSMSFDNCSVESLMATVVSPYIKDIGFLLTVLVPFCGAIISFRISNCLEQFIMIKTNEYIASSAFGLSARLCSVTRKNGDFSNDCIAIVNSAKSGDFAVMLLKFDATILAHLRSDWFKLKIRQEATIPVSDVTILQSSNIMAVESTEVQSIIMTFILQGTPQTGGFLKEYVGVVIFPLLDHNKAPSIILKIISPNREYTAWNILVHRNNPLRQLICRLTFSNPLLASNASSNFPRNLSVWSLSSFFANTAHIPVSEFSLSPLCITSAPFGMIISRNNTTSNCICSFSNNQNAGSSLLFALF